MVRPSCEQKRIVLRFCRRCQRAGCRLGHAGWALSRTNSGGRVLTPTDVQGLLERCGKLTLLGWQGVHTQTSSGKECDVIEIVRGDSAQVLPKRRSEPIVLPSFNLRNSATY